MRLRRTPKRLRVPPISRALRLFPLATSSLESSLQRLWKRLPRTALSPLKKARPPKLTATLLRVCSSTEAIFRLIWLPIPIRWRLSSTIPISSLPIRRFLPFRTFFRFSNRLFSRAKSSLSLPRTLTETRSPTLSSTSSAACSPALP